MVSNLTVRKGDGAGCPNRKGRSVPECNRTICACIKGPSVPDCNGTICAQMQQDHVSLLWTGPSVPGYMGPSVPESNGMIGACRPTFTCCSSFSLQMCLDQRCGKSFLPVYHPGCHILPARYNERL